MAKKYDRYADMPFNQQRILKHKQEDEWVVDFLTTAKIGHVATRWEEQPFITSSTFWFDVDKNVLYFHSNIVGRVRANIERHPQVCFETSDFGRFLPSNIALEFSLQYQSVIVFGKIEIVEDPQEKRAALVGLIEKYFPGMKSGQEYRPITENELKRTSLYAIHIESWSGKRNWKEMAVQSEDWKPLAPKWFDQ